MSQSSILSQLIYGGDHEKPVECTVDDKERGERSRDERHHRRRRDKKNCFSTFPKVIKSEKSKDCTTFASYLSSPQVQYQQRKVSKNANMKNSIKVSRKRNICSNLFSEVHSANLWYQEKSLVSQPVAAGYQVYKDAVRDLWRRCSYGGDIEGALQVLGVLAHIDGIHFMDLFQFMTLLREQEESRNPFQHLFHIMIRNPGPPSMRASIYRTNTIIKSALIKLFLDLLISEGKYELAMATVENLATDFHIAHDETFKMYVCLLKCYTQVYIFDAEGDDESVSNKDRTIGLKNSCRNPFLFFRDIDRQDAQQMHNLQNLKSEMSKLVHQHVYLVQGGDNNDVDSDELLIDFICIYMGLMHFTNEATKSIQKTVKLLFSPSSSSPSSSHVHLAWRRLQYHCTFTCSFNARVNLSATVLKARETLLQSARLWIAASLQLFHERRVNSISSEMFHTSVLLYNINAQFLNTMDFFRVLTTVIETFPSSAQRLKKNYEWTIWRTLATFLCHKADDPEIEQELKDSLQWWNEYYFAPSTVCIDDEDSIDLSTLPVAGPLPLPSQASSSSSSSSSSLSSSSSSSLHGYGFFGKIAAEQIRQLGPGVVDNVSFVGAIVDNGEKSQRGKKRKNNGWDDDDDTSTTGSRLDSSTMEEGDARKEEGVDDNQCIDEKNENHDDDGDDNNDEDLLLELIDNVRDGFVTSARYLAMMMERQPVRGKNLDENHLELWQDAEILTFKLSVHIFISKAKDKPAKVSTWSSLYAEKVCLVLKSYLERKYTNFDAEPYKKRLMAFLNMSQMSAVAQYINECR